MASPTSNQETQQKIQLFNRWALFYDWLLPSVFYQAIHRRLLSYVQLPDNPWVLDLGCGTGQLLERLAKNFPHLYGIGLDASPEMLRQARNARRYSPRLIYIEGDATDLPTADNQFDAVFNTISFLHYPQPRQVLSEVYRTLKPQGRYYLVDWVWEGTESQVEIAAGAGKIRFYSLSKRAELGTQMGFQFINHHWLLASVALTIFEKPPESPRDGSYS
ncbi:MAG: class I SAM-dependent methyltransferase [Halothece sp.]